MKKTKKLLDEYRFPGFRPKAKLKGLFGDPQARVIELKRRQKKPVVAVAGLLTGVFMTARYGKFATCLVAGSGSIWKWKYAGCFAASVGK